MLKKKDSSDESQLSVFFQSVFQNCPDAIAVTRLSDGIIFHVNDGFFRVTGYLPTESIGKTTLGLNLYRNPKDREHILMKIRRDRLLNEESVQIVRKDGSDFTGYLSARIFTYNKVDYVNIHLRDHSEQSRLEYKVQESEEKYRLLFETMDQGIVYQDAAGKIISANPAAERMLGLSIEEMKLRTSLSPEWRTMHEDGSPLSGDEHPSMVALKTGNHIGPQIVGVYNSLLDDHVWLSVTATPLFHKGEDRPYQVYVVLKDISQERHAQKNYQQLFHEMIDAFALHEMIFDSDGSPVDYRFIAVNPAFEQMTGLKKEDLIGRTVLEVIPNTEHYWIETYGHVASTGEPITFQNYSAPLQKHFNVTAYRPAPGQFACTFSNITERILMQEEAQKAEEQIGRLAHICNIAPGAIIVHDYNGKILYANEIACALHQYSLSEMLTMNLRDLSTSTAEEISERFRLIGTYGEATFESIHLAQTGSSVPFFIYAKQFEWDGTPAVLSTGTNLSERLKAEQQIKEMLEQNERILNNLQDAYFQADLDGSFRMLNPRAIEMYGYSQDAEMKRVSMHQLYADPEGHAALLEKLKSNGRVTNYECLALKKSGLKFWISMHVQYQKDDAGIVTGIEGLIRDISKRKALEEEVEKQHQSLIETNEVLENRLKQSINALSKMGELRDVYTAGHQKRVQQLACEIGRYCGMSQEAITNLSYGALIHDIGKIYIASDILNKPGKITNLEYQILQTHAEHGYHIVREIDLPQEILTMILQHHERLDGSGYPGGLQGDQIILESKILAVADVVEAMTSHRPYRPALGIDAALNEIEVNKGTKFDPAIVDICVSLFRKHNFSFVES